MRDHARESGCVGNELRDELGASLRAALLSSRELRETEERSASWRICADIYGARVLACRRAQCAERTVKLHGVPRACQCAARAAFAAKKTSVSPGRRKVLAMAEAQQEAACLLPW